MANLTVDSSFFDCEYERKNTGSLKYGVHPNGDSNHNLIPMWIADMDFKVPPQVEQSLVDTARHGIFGYSSTDDEYDSALVSWYRRRMHWNIEPNWIVQMPGVMFAVSSTIRALTNVGDAVLICQPVYYPFAKIISANKRNLIVSELRLVNDRYEYDFADFERKIADNHVKLFLLCSPHNPVGRVWTKEELTEIGRICIKYNVTIVSDEIHSDIVYQGSKHIPLASISDEIADRSVICTSPTKTFNLAGLQAAHIMITNTAIRQKVKRTALAAGYGGLNSMAIAAAKAAYLYGEPWLDGLLSYLQGNISLLQDALSGTNGKITLVKPEGTYLMWLNCRNLKLSDRQLELFFLKEAGLWLHNGTTFGEGGGGMMRMNIACPRTVLQRAIARLEQALHKADQYR